MIENNVNHKSEQKSYMDKREESLMKWVDFWRKNLHRFVEDYMGIHLMFFQKLIIFMMNIIPNVVYIAARGQGKSFLTAIFVVSKCILYPGIRIVISSATKKQAVMIISQKILDLYKKYPSIRAEIGPEKNIKTGNETGSVEFLNGSTIYAVTSSETARGIRSNVLVVDEYVMVDHDMYQGVLRPTQSSPRIPRFKEKNPVKYAWYVEPNIEILLSSAKYKNGWGWQSFKKNIEQMINSKSIEESRFFAVALPYQISVLHGLLTQEKIDEDISNESMDKSTFKMEYEALFVGENDGAFFSLDAINSNRTIKKAFNPPTDLEYISNKTLSNPKNLCNIPKQKGEIRLVGLDVAMVGGKQNDTSAFTCMRMIPSKSDGYIRQVVRIETVHDATIDTELAIRLKQLYYDFDADYAIIDTMGYGDSVYIRCAEILYDPKRDIEYEPWESINDSDMRDRVKQPNGKRVVYTIKASARFNNDIAINLRSAFENKKLELLIDEVSARNDFFNTDKFTTLSLEQQQRLLQPYQITTALINELIDLQYNIIQGGNVQIKEPNGGTKDRYSSLAYTNYIANEIEKGIKNKESNSSGYSSYISEFSWKRDN